MKSIVTAMAVSVCMVSLAAISSADTLILKNGTRVPGTVVSVAGRTITFEDASGVSRRYNANQVTGLEFTPASQHNAAIGTSGNNRRLETLPSGTELTVRTAELMARPDPRDLPGRTHVCRYEGDPDRREVTRRRRVDDEPLPANGRGGERSADARAVG